MTVLEDVEVGQSTVIYNFKHLKNILKTCTYTHIPSTYTPWPFIIIAQSSDSLVLCSLLELAVQTKIMSVQTVDHGVSISKERMRYLEVSVNSSADTISAP